MVHNNDSYSSIEKFDYLRSTLSGQALDVIKWISITEKNYSVAINKLQQRYSSINLAIQTHVHAILDYPCIKSASAIELQNLLSHVSSHISALESLGQPTEQWDAWLVTVILRKVDQTTNYEWRLNDTNLSTYCELEKFILNRCRAFEIFEMDFARKEILRNPTSSSILKKANDGVTKKELKASTIKKGKCR